MSKLLEIFKRVILYLAEPKLKQIEERNRRPKKVIRELAADEKEQILKVLATDGPTQAAILYRSKTNRDFENSEDYIRALGLKNPQAWPPHGTPLSIDEQEMLMDALVASSWIGANAMYNLLRLASDTESEEAVSDLVERAEKEFGNVEFSELERAQAIRTIIEHEVPRALSNKSLRLKRYTKEQRAALFKSHALMAEACSLAHHSDYSDQSYEKMMKELQLKFPEFSSEQCAEVLGRAMISMR